MALTRNLMAMVSLMGYVPAVVGVDPVGTQNVLHVGTASVSQVETVTVSQVGTAAVSQVENVSVLQAVLGLAVVAGIGVFSLAVESP
jgi:hypothetical protein